ncbi:hypothetical protein EPI10_005551 [Gossypium australe]|uniref:Uncharacterized protein n=1 Tax=Gossypium australe TaxID=47621 RepID=A0A5B6WNM7_9ROSI|nr:hypothetical protein EPI10_005551 [Gossypium australe]
MGSRKLHGNSRKLCKNLTITYLRTHQSSYELTNISGRKSLLFPSCMSSLFSSLELIVLAQKSLLFISSGGA